MTSSRFEDWPSEVGEMASRIGAFDWASTALGPIETWSERLRLIVEQVLANPLVATLACGTERVLIYNDAAARLYGDHHPAALGRPLPESFPEGWATVAPLYARAFAGETVRVLGQRLDTRGEGGSEDVFDALLMPVREVGGRVAHVHMIGSEVGERARTEAALRDSEALLRVALASGRMGTWRADARSAMVEVDAVLARIWGLPSGDMAYPVSTFTARLSAEGREELSRAGSRAVASGEDIDGTLDVVEGPSAGRWVRWRGRARSHEPWVMEGVSFDVTEQKLIERALRGSEARLRTLVEGLPQLVWRAIDGGLWTWASPQWTAYTGQPEPDSHGRGWLEPVHPEDRDAVTAVWADAVERGEFHADCRVRNAAEGRYRWFQTRATPVRDERGEVVEWLGTSTDIDDLRRLQERQDVLVAELQHRTRNLIAVVRGIADETMEHTGPTEAFRGAFANRMSALARVQGLLSRSEAEPIGIGALVRLELDALGAGAPGGQVTVDGPEVFLKPSTVQTLALGLHELATNARKYGALSHDRGRLAITWRERVEGDARRLALDWVETGREQAPERPISPSAGSGYGRELIERALPHALGARTSYALTSSGVRCTIDMPVRSGRGGSRDDDGGREVER